MSTWAGQALGMATQQVDVAPTQPAAPAAPNGRAGATTSAVPGQSVPFSSDLRNDLTPDERRRLQEAGR